MFALKEPKFEIEVCFMVESEPIYSDQYVFQIEKETIQKF